MPAVYAPSFIPGDFDAEVIHGGDLKETVARVAEHEPVALIAGIESGVELADAPSEAFGLLTNGSQLSSARRDKHRTLPAPRLIRGHRRPVQATLRTSGLPLAT
ncbi:hypothetical protein [Streptomyces sp. NBC_01483]|uniref:hypothetical protein n=1 Tax=Streptomyces sp. NBC_01483 TaxID=2903883 RepID=UPI002E34BB54|nr:hypothetical protein [Streptomyces sp. NBC_01483]